MVYVQIYAWTYIVHVYYVVLLSMGNFYIGYVHLSIEKNWAPLSHIRKDYIINMDYVGLSTNLCIHHVRLSRNLYVHYVRLITSLSFKLKNDCLQGKQQKQTGGKD